METFSDCCHYEPLKVIVLKEHRCFELCLMSMLHTSPPSLSSVVVQILIDRGSCSTRLAQSEHPDLPASSV